MVVPGSPGAGSTRFAHQPSVMVLDHPAPFFVAEFDWQPAAKADWIFNTGREPAQVLPDLHAAVRALKLHKVSTDPIAGHSCNSFVRLRGVRSAARFTGDGLFY